MPSYASGVSSACSVSSASTTATADADYRFKGRLKVVGSVGIAEVESVGTTEVESVGIAQVDIHCPFRIPRRCGQVLDCCPALAPESLECRWQRSVQGRDRERQERDGEGDRREVGSYTWRVGGSDVSKEFIEEFHGTHTTGANQLAERRWKK
jgi:hypothetical protein